MKNSRHTSSQKPKHSLPTQGEIRLIGGRFRRRIIRFPSNEHVRPTPNRVRETLFNWLGQTLDQQHTLDLFGGSGALSLEALSRGAASATVIDLYRANTEALRVNALQLDPNLLSTLHILTQDTKQALAQLPTAHFDIIFADPPFGEFEKWLPIILTEATRLLKPTGFLYLESPQACQPTAPFEDYREATAGQVHYHLWKIKQAVDEI